MKVLPLKGTARRPPAERAEAPQNSKLWSVLVCYCITPHCAIPNTHNAIPIYFTPRTRLPAHCPRTARAPPPPSTNQLAASELAPSRRHAVAPSVAPLPRRSRATQSSYGLRILSAKPTERCVSSATRGCVSSAKPGGRPTSRWLPREPSACNRMLLTCHSGLLGACNCMSLCYSGLTLGSVTDLAYGYRLSAVRRHAVRRTAATSMIS